MLPVLIKLFFKFIIGCYNQLVKLFHWCTIL